MSYGKRAWMTFVCIDYSTSKLEKTRTFYEKEPQNAALLLETKFFVKNIFFGVEHFVRVGGDTFVRLFCDDKIVLVDFF